MRSRLQPGETRKADKSNVGDYIGLAAMLVFIGTTVALALSAGPSAGPWDPYGMTTAAKAHPDWAWLSTASFTVMMVCALASALLSGDEE